MKPRKMVPSKPKRFHRQELYALGWDLLTYHGELVISHEGSTTGFRGKTLYLPYKQWGFVLLGSTDDAGDISAEQICWTMIDDLLDVPMDQRYDWDAAAQRGQGREQKKEPMERLYPKVPATPIPTTLPLSQYVGSYRHNGYDTLVEEMNDGKLWVDANDRTWPFTLSLEHASENSFVATQTETHTQETTHMKAQFRVDSDDEVQQLGLDFAEELKEEMIWFESWRHRSPRS